MRCEVSNLGEMERSFLQSPLARDRLKGSPSKRDGRESELLTAQVVIDTSMLKPTLVAVNQLELSKSSSFR